MIIKRFYYLHPITKERVEVDGYLEALRRARGLHMSLRSRYAVTLFSSSGDVILDRRARPLHLFLLREGIDTYFIRDHTVSRAKFKLMRETGRAMVLTLVRSSKGLI